MKLADFENKHTGRLAFVLAAGPSLHYEKLEGIGQYVTLVSNSAFLKLKSADYFVSGDVGAADWDYFTRSLPKAECVKFLASDSLKQHALRFNNDVCFFERKFRFDFKTKQPIADGLVATADGKLPVIDGSISAALAVHIAHIMGCNPIVLLGTDCCYIQEKKYFWQFPGEAKPQRLRGVTLPTRTRLVRGKTLDDNNREALEMWAAIGRSNPYLNVINGATQGLLDSFPRMAYAEVIARYGALTKQNGKVA